MYGTYYQRPQEYDTHTSRYFFYALCNTQVDFEGFVTLRGHKTDFVDYVHF